MPIKLGFLLCFTLAFIAIRSESAVMSIDLGSEWVKVAVVNLKPGQPPISITINEMSKRKSPSLVAFHFGDRLIGEEAAGLVARYPEKAYIQIRDLIGKPVDHAKRKLAEFHSKVAVKDAVISVPGYFGQAERKGVLQAAQLAGINVLSLVNEHSGAALQYGIDKNFANESRHVVFYDMG